MTTLNQLISNMAYHNLAGVFTELDLAMVGEIGFNNFCLDSRKVQEADVFVLLSSTTQTLDKSVGYALQVIEKSAFIISEIPVQKLFDVNSNLQKYQQKLVAAPRIRECLGDLIRVQLQQIQKVRLPAVVAVTGTNGKTTISQLVAQLTEQSGKASAIMGTAGNGRLGALIQSTHTTGDVLAVQRFVHEMGVDNIDILALEASSHGLDQYRLQGVPVQVAIYTNLSRDHLDYHSNMDDYARAKARLFNRNHFPTLTHAIINLDDEYATTMLESASNSGVQVWTYSMQTNKQATFVAQQIKPSLTGVEIEVVSDFGTVWLNSPLLGLFNVANLLAAVAGAYALAVDMQAMPTLVAKLRGADGRMDRVESEKGCFIVDYAHTPDALTQVLASLKAHCKGNLWAVFGCGGDRDKGKRPLMAQAGLAEADKVILTADNPRSEDPMAILQDMQVGMTDEQYTRTHIEPNRQTAIEYAVNQAQDNDIVVIAGKGHEAYQEIKGVRYDFDDRVVLKEALASILK
ncbi:MAG: UDP-N-acetylmuramoyl-L-alanyl-D-glutamate--2,6-diaminopimelate ligase [Gammaproteobacteria bacterium]|nr:MAG: UDP-N-acetylmuramoyl-L-alanyl-D-glutamate--2,6-diaminopimelate ligase [Gammaproteobacteria bacterium]